MYDVFGARGCVGCLATLALLDAHRVPYRFRRPGAMSEHQRVQVPPGFTETPIVFENNTFVGGQDALEHHLLGGARGARAGRSAAPPTGRFVVYGRDTCGYTQQALALLDDVGASSEYVRTTDRPLAPLHAARAEGHPTVPMVFRDDVFVGGFSQLQTLLG